MAENAEIPKEMSGIKDNDSVAVKSLTMEGIQCFNLDKLDLDLEDIESIEIGTSKGIEKIKASDLMTVLKTHTTATGLLEKQNKDGDISIKESEHCEILDVNPDTFANNSKSDNLAELFKDFYSTVKTSGWLEENTVDKMKSENPELFAGVMEIQEKKALGIDDNSIPEEYEIIPQNSTTNNDDHALMDLMTDLHQQIKSSNWLEEQNKALANKPKTTADSHGNVKLDVDKNMQMTDELKILTNSGNLSELENLMLQHMHSIKTTDWMAANNPEVATELVEVTQQKQNVNDKSISEDRR